MRRLSFVTGTRGGEPFADLVSDANGDMIELRELFVRGPDGKRHPTQEEIDAVILGRADRDQEGYVHEMLDRLSTVAPKEE